MRMTQVPSNDRPRILAIDDMPTNLMVLASALAGDFIIQLAASGPEGLVMAQNHPPDLVLLDVMMPDVDGFEACKRFKSDPRLKNIPIVFVTALTDNESEMKGLRLGAVDYLHKPVNVAIARQRIRNVLERAEFQRKLQASESRLRQVIEASNLGSWEWNIPDDQFVVNERWASMLGYDIDELKPSTMATRQRLVHPDDEEKAKRLLNDHFKGLASRYDCELRLAHKSGHWIWVHERGKVVETDQHGQPCVMFGTLSDISERKNIELQIRETAIRDPLTNVYNRRHLLEHIGTNLAAHSRTERPMSIAMLDLDHFKDVNDTFGHEAGDTVLKAFTRTVQESIRSYDLLARFGGEEFVLVFPDTPKVAACQLIERIMEKFRQNPPVHGDHKIPVTFSCGLAENAEIADTPQDFQAFLGLADQRMYEAKRNGRDRCCMG